MKILIAGATGYLGFRLARRFLDNPPPPQYRELLLLVRNKDNLSKDLQDRDNVFICEINSVSLEKTIEIFSPDIVYCTTCCYETDPEYLLKTIDANYVFPSRILRIVANLQTDRLVRFISVGTSLPSSLNLYSLTKKHFVELGTFFHQKVKVKFVNLLLESFYGVDEPGDRFITRSILQLKANKDLLLTEGIQKRDYVFIDDVIEIMFFFSTCDINKDVYDIPVGSGIAPTIKEIILFLHREIGSKSNLKFGAIKMREHEPSTVADLSIIRQLGYSKPLVHWQDGMKKLIRERMVF
jgi:CDP-paratose synthetase